MLELIFQPFVDNRPMTVMAAEVTESLLSMQRLDALFGKARQEQYVIK